MRPDFAERLLATVVRAMPAERRDWGRAMLAELAAIDGPADRRGFARGCARAAVTELHPVRGVLHLAVVLCALGPVLAWIVAVGYPPLVAILGFVATVLAAVAWAARRAGLLGPTGGGAAARLLSGGGYLLAGGIAVAGSAHPTGPHSDGVLVFSLIAAAFLLALPLARARVLVTGGAAGLGPALLWLLAVVVVPPIPVSLGSGLLVAGLATLAAIAINARSTADALTAGLLAASVTMVAIFFAVVLLARFGPDTVIPAITPYALPGHEVSESRIEIVDPYVAMIVLGGLAATVLSVAGLLARRPGPARSAR